MGTYVEMNIYNKHLAFSMFESEYTRFNCLIDKVRIFDCYSVIQATIIYLYVISVITERNLNIIASK